MPFPQIASGTSMSEFFRQLVKSCPWVDGQFVSFTTAASTALQSTQHGLGRPYRGGWIVSHADAAAVTVDVVDPAGNANTDKSVYLRITPGNAVAVTLWVY